MEELADLIGPELGKFDSCGIQIIAEHMLSHSSPNMLTALNIYAHLLKLDLAKKCMIVEELIMAEEQTKS